jgi:hypothetical protein
MNLFEIDKTIREVLNQGFSVDPETGELLFETSDLVNLEATKKEKFLAIAKMVKENQAMIKAFKEEEKAMSTRRKSLENKNISLTQWALLNMGEGDKFEDAQAKISYSKGSESVEVLTIENLDPKYITEKYTHTADKKALKEALKSGEFIEGVTLVRNAQVRIK